MPGLLLAGNGPQNWLVVYDPGDPHGVAIARYYQQARGFPDRNLVAYSFPRRAAGSPSLKHVITAAEGWALIQSLRTTMTARGLDGQIHGITLVGNAPNAMDSTSIGTVALTTALAVAPGTTSQSGWEARLDDYSTVFRGPTGGSSGTFHPTTEVRSDISFTSNYYWLSTHLGFTGIHGLRPDEVFTLIDRASAADGTAPEGTVYWPLNFDVRSTTRENQAPIVEKEWQALGLRYHIYGQSYGGGSYFTPDNKTGAPGSHPHTSRAVQGAVAGAWTFELDSQPSLYTPGAIAEQLTSYGGLMGGTLGWSQSECTLWLRAGAAGTSGTVMEPFAYWYKFPHARIHSHYFNGATLAEAFLMSLYRPQQTLVMGDGLTQPYAKIPAISLTGVAERQTLSGTVTLGATAAGAAGVEANLDLAIDGRVIKIGAPGESVGATRVAGGFQIDTTTLSDGWHELRVVAYAANAVRSQGFATRTVFVNNAGGSVAITGPTAGVRGATIPLNVNVTGVAGVTSIEVRALGQVLATLSASGGTANIPASSLSYHTATPVFAVAKTASGKEVSSAPHAITVEWTPQPALAEVPTIPGAVAVARIFSGDVKAAGFNWNTAIPVAVVPVDERWAVHVEAGDQWPFLKSPINKGGGVEFVTRFYARETGVYDFVLQGMGEMGMAVDGIDLVPGVISGWPVMPSTALAAGWHEVRLRTSIPTGAPTWEWQFQPAFRARYTRRPYFFNWPVVEYEYFTMEHCAAPVTAMTLPLLSGRATGVGEATLNWRHPFGATATGWKVDRHTGDAAVSLVQYLGSATPPTLVNPEHPDGLRPMARVANDGDEGFAIVPPWLQGGVRLLTAGADRAAGLSAMLYRVQVPAGTTVYAVFERGNEGGPPAWITNQGGWIKVSGWDTSGNPRGFNVSSETTNLWFVYKKSFAADTLLELGGAGRAVNDTRATRAITFSFHKDAGVWEEVATLAGSATGTTVGTLAAGPNRLRVRAQLPPSVDIPSNEVTLNLASASANGAPVVQAGPNLQVAGVGIPVTLAGAAQDDELPSSPGALTTAWSQVSGSGSVVFADGSVASTSATFSLPGVYELLLTVGDGELSSEDTVRVTVTGDAAANAAPVAAAGPDQVILATQSVTLAGSATDDGLPSPPATLAYRWRQVSGPGTVTFHDPAKPNTKAYFSAPGAYQLELAVSDGAKAGTDTLTFTVGTDSNIPPVVNAGADRNAYAMRNVPLAGVVSDDGLPNPPGAVTARWFQISGPGTATFSNSNSTTSSAYFPAAGDYVLSLSADDGGQLSSDTVRLTVVPDDENNTAPTVGVNANLVFDHTGIYFIDPLVSDDGLPRPPGMVSESWELLSGPGQFAGLAKDQGTAASLLAFDAPGEYQLRLTANDGRLQSEKTITAIVADTRRYGNVYAWGWSYNYSCGPFYADSSLTPPARIGWQWKHAAINASSAFVVTADGKVLSCGLNSSYQLGHAGSTSYSRRHFAEISGLSDVIQVAHPYYGGVVLKSNGTVWTWGSNYYGEWGNGSTSTGDRSDAQQVPGLTGVVHIASSGNIIVAVKSDGTVWGWGANSFGQLGIGSTVSPQRSPVQMTGITNAVEATTGEYSIIRLADGTLRSVGRNNKGQLGDGTITDRLTPVQVLKALTPDEPLTGIRQISSFSAHVLAVDELGGVWAWGNNSNGRLGIGDTLVSLSTYARRAVDPTDPAGYLTGVRKVAADTATSFALKTDGSLMGWGYGSRYAWGSPDDTTHRFTPGPVVNLPPLADIWAGYYSAIGVTGRATYDSFVAEHFTTQEIAAGKAAPGYDYLGGGRPNLLVYATGGDPKAAGSSPLAWTRFEGGQFVFETEYLAAASDLAIEIESSSNLSIWNPATPATVEELDLGDMSRQTLRFNLDPGSPRFFLRLRAQKLTAP